MRPQVIPLIANRVLDWPLLPVVWWLASWVRRREAEILRRGTALTPQQASMAGAVGVTHVARIRIMAVDVVTMPLPRLARGAAERLGWLSPHIAAMTCGYGIALRRDVFGNCRLLAHELAHVAQYERLGRFSGFLRHYVRECVWPGYPRGPLEIEARAAEATGARAHTQGVGNVLPYTGTEPRNAHADTQTARQSFS